MSPIVDVFQAMDAAHTAQLAAENQRLRAENAGLRTTLAAYDQRIDLLQRANEAHESRGFTPRQEAS